MDDKDEERMLELVRAAAELEDFEADVRGRMAGDSMARPPRAAAVRWLKIAAPILAVAAVVAFVLLPPRLTFQSVTVRPPAVRTPDAAVELAIALSRPAYLRVVIIDENNERWIRPIDHSSTYVVKVNERQVLKMPAVPDTVEPRPGAPRFVLLIASTGPQPTADDLLQRVSDPIAPPGSDMPAVRRALDQIAADLAQNYGCAVHIASMPD